jgi:hypothetical protein
MVSTLAVPMTENAKVSRLALKAVPVPIQWHSSLSVFAKEEFLSAVGDEYGWLGGLDESENLRCVLPYTIVRKAGLRMVRFRVETMPCGVALDPIEETSFLNSVVRHFRRIRADVIIPASTNAIFRSYPESAIAAPYGTYFIGLEKPEDALWAGVSASHRRHVRSAQKSGMQVRNSLDRISTAHTIITDTFKKSSMPFMPLKSFERLIAGLQGNVHLLVSELQNQVQSCAVIAFSQHAAYYMYGGSTPDAAPGAMHLLHWEAICQYRRLGVCRYDFYGARIDPAPGSKAAGLAAFKERFGAELDRGFIWKCDISPLKSKVYSFAVRWLRGGDIVDAEHHKLDRTASSVVISQERTESSSGTPTYSKDRT